MPDARVPEAWVLDARVAEAWVVEAWVPEAGLREAWAAGVAGSEGDPCLAQRRVRDGPLFEGCSWTLSEYRRWCGAV